MRELERVFLFRLTQLANRGLSRDAQDGSAMNGLAFDGFVHTHNRIDTALLKVVEALQWFAAPVR
jgi:hypothetical protein